MPSPFDASVNALWLALKQAGGVTVIYTRRSDSTQKNLIAVRGSTATESDLGDGVVRTDRMFDWILKISDLGFEPERGDTIKYIDRLYEVMNPTGGKHVEEQALGTLYRIHTKEVYAG